MDTNRAVNGPTVGGWAIAAGFGLLRAAQIFLPAMGFVSIGLGSSKRPSDGTVTADSEEFLLGTAGKSDCNDRATPTNNGWLVKQTTIRCRSQRDYLGSRRSNSLALLLHPEIADNAVLKESSYGCLARSIWLLTCAVCSFADLLELGASGSSPTIPASGSSPDTGSALISPQRLSPWTLPRAEYCTLVAKPAPGDFSLT
jgi:hypothetical protein